MNPQILVVSVVVACLVRTGLAIDCHQCASKDGAGCIDPYDLEEGEGNIDGCDDMDTHCLKIKLIATLKDSGAILGEDRRSVTTTRGCIREDGSGDYCKAYSSAEGVMIKCICAGESCNGVAELGSSLTLVLLTVAAVIGAWKML